MLGQAHTETGFTQGCWVDTGFHSHERHPKASRGRADVCQAHRCRLLGVSTRRLEKLFETMSDKLQLRVETRMVLQPNVLPDGWMRVL